MPIIPSAFEPTTKRAIARMVRYGVRDVRNAALFLGVSRSRVRDLICRGALWSFKHNGKRVVPVQELRRYLAMVAVQ